MSQLIIVAFDNMEEAERVRDTIHKEQNLDMIHLDDSAVIVRDEAGKLHIKNEVDRGVKSGILWGSLIGLLLGGIFAPLLGIALGALGGGLLGKSVSNSIDKNFTEDIAAALTPGTSAIAFIFRGDDPSAAIAVFRPYQGKILQTTLSEDDEKALREELKSRIK